MIDIVNGDISTRLADKSLVKYVKEFTDTMYKQMGAHVFMMVGYQDLEGVYVRSKYVTSLCALLWMTFYVLSGLKLTQTSHPRSSTLQYLTKLAKKHGTNMMIFCRAWESVVSQGNPSV